MLIVHVNVRVHANAIEDFIAATRDNARASVLEPGVVRFDLVQREDDPTRFLLIEIYRDEDAPAAHKATEHYAAWRDRVADMMAEPRTSLKYAALFPAPESWAYPASPVA